MKRYIILVVALVCITSCRSAKDEPVATIEADIARLQDEARQAGDPTDARLRAAAGKIKNVSFPCDYRAACQIIGIPDIWIAGRCSSEEDKGFLWLKFTYPDAGSILFKTRHFNLENVFDMRIEVDKGSNTFLRGIGEELAEP